MRINRLICIFCILGFGTFATYFGGNVSYAFFYLALFTPLVAFLYTLYVYFRFKLYQSVDSRLVVKGDWTLYSFVIANEDFIAFRNVKVKFLSDKSTIESTAVSTEYSLIPSDSERLNTRLKCNYRGEYYVGVDTIEVMDFLYLFKITYPIRSKLKAIVLPRVVQLEQLGIAPPQMDVKNPIRNSVSAEEELDMELRTYQPGDPRKHIHWKATAKQQELLSRKYNHKPKEEIVLFMDLSEIKEDELSVIITEDKIIESILAIANYYSARGTVSHIIYEMLGIKHIKINSKEDFRAFYQTCVNIHFGANHPIYEIMKERLLGDRGLFYVVATHDLTKDFYLLSLQALAQGNHLCVLFISDDVSEGTAEMIANMKLAGASVYQVLSEDEIGDILSKGNY